MAIYSYKAKDAAGQAIVGAVEAPTESAAIDVLRDKALTVISLAERRRLGALQMNVPFLNRISVRDVVIFARQLAVMISATVPVVQALRILTRQTSNATFKIKISEIADEVEGGAKLSAALGRHEGVFNDFFVNMVRSGETTGRLDETLTYLADQQEKDYDLQSKIRGALIYPVFILSGVVIVGTIMMIFVIPKMTQILVESGAVLPFSTRVLIGTSAFLATKWWLVLLLAVLIVAGYRALRKTVSGHVFLDRLRLHVPIIGSIFRKIYVARLARGLSTLLVSGIPLTRSLEVVSDIIGNSVYRALTQQAIKEVEDGNPLSTTFSQSQLVPAMLGQMMNVGEQTGRLDQILAKLADFFAKEVENAVTNLVTLIEPLILVVMGVGVGLLVSAVLLPIYNLSSSF